ncbi:phosphoenolpyruvate--protein phosphotransferase [Desulfonema ishimotonii]|uniref:phosphoenolpyruvate--protein phosphotransferase n=1 Tax=Desulfonema ishimotonii TaxID=45657 RepID=A0A401G1Z5_9BACT|nr:phosphoenolpyruvate--protein phosphotransferase [Desulfonema ishimotonii]GBC63216.1 phosphoenolpyruvate--protein phosphotransferase [Desulfonema ishimotonii]
MTRKKHDHFDLLCNISDLSNLVAESQDIEGFLRRAVELVSRHLEANVCSIYLHDENSGELVLKSTLGLNQGAVGVIRMKPGEGLVGTTFEQLRPIRESFASCNPLFKYFEEADEDRFESFLAVPIQRGVQKIGVMVVQHEKTDYFTEADVMALRASASQLASAIENARLLMDLYEATGKSPEEIRILENLRFIRGKTASDGYAVGPATIFRKSHGALLSGRSDGCTLYTQADFHAAVRKTSDQLMALQTRLAERLPESASLIFTAHFMILKDPKFVNKIEDHIEKGVPAPDAVRAVARHYISIFSSSPQAYIREKANDMEDLAGRILRNLHWHETEEAARPDKGTVVIAAELYPSEILKMASEDIRGIILVKGGITSHVSILARSLKIPLVIADDPRLMDLPEGTPVLIDGGLGAVCVNPDKEMVRQIEEQQKIGEAAGLSQKPLCEMTQTRDGVRVRLLVNINLLSELKTATDLNAEGIGLYRTEFPFIVRPTFPSEEEQYVVYRRLFEGMAGRLVSIRTLDVGGDKVLAYSNITSGDNPELGLRSIRFSLYHRNLFKQQLRAILRAAAGADHPRIMFPMISSIDEFREARQIVCECIDELAQEKLAHHPDPAIGIMVEVPSVVEIIDGLAREADFFSIGTNDFVQYTLAVDRTNEKVAQYYRPWHPAVLRGLARIVRAAVSAGTDVSVCGEMGHEPEYIPFLIGIGIRTLSVDPGSLLAVHEQIRGLPLADAEVYAQDLLAEETLGAVSGLLGRYARGSGDAH